MALAFGNLKTAALRTRQLAVSNQRVAMLRLYQNSNTVVTIDLDTFY